jgi:cobalt-zinc-cadmium efflux system outer membrane protein
MMRAALAVARLNRLDAQRVLESMVKQAYVGVAISRAELDLSRSIATSLQRSLDLAKVRYPAVITEADLARTEVQKLEGDAAVTNAVANLRQAQALLAVLLGARTVATDFGVDPVDYSVPASLDGATEQSLVALALRSRPDLRARAYDRTRALASLDLARRQRFPDIAFNAVYTSVGSGAGAASPSALGFGATANLPIFYQQQGEISKAQADVTASTLTQAKAESIVATDVGTAYAGYVSAKHLVERMKTGGLLDRAQTAKDILEKQYLGGTASLVNYLDAQRTFIATNEEYIADLGAYWTSIYQLEQALGVEVH